MADPVAVALRGRGRQKRCYGGRRPSTAGAGLLAAQCWQKPDYDSGFPSVLGVTV